MSGSEPKWPTLTRMHHKERVEQFSANLRAVASSIASHQRVDSTSVIHVDEAHAALAKAGLVYEKWYRRTEFRGRGRLVTRRRCVLCTKRRPFCFSEEC